MARPAPVAFPDRPARRQATQFGWPVADWFIRAAALTRSYLDDSCEP